MFAGPYLLRRGVMSTGNEEFQQDAVREPANANTQTPASNDHFGSVVASTAQPVPAEVSLTVGIPGQDLRQSGPVRSATGLWGVSVPPGPPRTGTGKPRRWRQPLRRREVRRAGILFLLTFASTLLVGANFFPFDYLLGLMSPGYYQYMSRIIPNLEQVLRDSLWMGFLYAGPVMLILVFHEMGHYLQAVRYGVPASLPYFIPLPVAPLGTMGAVIFQSPGAATRKQMFDIAVSGPLAGLVATIPVLWFGLANSQYMQVAPGAGVGLSFGEPLLLTWMVELLHGPAAQNQVFVMNPVAMAGWVGLFVTSLNLLPIGQLDGGHILYTLIRRRAHAVAVLLYGSAIASVIFLGNTSFVLLLLLLLLTGIRHPPTADDSESLGFGRHIVGWLTLAFLIIGFTPEPISIKPLAPQQSANESTEESLQPANEPAQYPEAPREELMI
jgi:Zn-dependent protease